MAFWDGSKLLPLGDGLSASQLADVTRVRELLVLPDGSLVAGGSFCRLGSRAIGNLAIFRDGRWEELGGGLVSMETSNEGVWSLSLTSPGTLLVGGDFSKPGTQVHNAAEVNLETGPWIPLAPAMEGTVYAIKRLNGGDTVMAGNFAIAGDPPIRMVAKLSRSTWTQLGGTSLRACDRVRTLIQRSSGEIVVGLIGGDGPIVYSLRGNVWHPLDAGSANARASLEAPGVYTLSESLGRDLHVGGSFRGIGALTDVSDSAVLRGTVWQKISPDVLLTQTSTGSWLVRSIISLADGSYVLGGRFTEVGDQSASNIVIANRIRATQMTGGIGDAINRIVRLPGHGLVAEGVFSNLAAQAHNVTQLAEWNGATWRLDAGVSDVSFGTVAVNREKASIALRSTFEQRTHTTIARYGYFNGRGWRPFQSPTST